MVSKILQQNIPDGWSEVTLESLTPQEEKYGIVDGPFGSNLKTIHYKQEGIPIISSGHVTNGYFQADDYLYVTPEKYEQEKRSSVKAGDIVMAKIGARCGASAILPHDHQSGILSGNALKITIDDSRNLTAYVWQVLSWLNNNKQLDKLRSVGAQPALSMPSLKKLKLVLPPLVEQRRIMKILIEWDGTIEKLEQTITLKREVKKGLMQKLLTGELRLPGFKGEWKKYLIGEVFEYIRTYAVSRENLVDGKFNVGLVGNVHYGDLHSKFSTSIDLDSDEIPQVIDESFVFQLDDCLRDGDLIMADASEDYEGIAVTVSIHNVKDKKIVGGLHTFVLRDKKGLTSEYYRQFIFKVQDVRRQLRRVANGVSVYGVSKSNISKIPILLPPPEEQEEIAKVLVSAEKEIVLLERKKKKLVDQKKYLLNNLVTGKIRTPENL